MKLLFTMFFLAFFSICISQTKVNLIKKDGVYEVSCKVNGKDTRFIFDSGASDVQISKEFFIEGLKNGIFKSSDLFSDIVEFQIANGDVVKGKNINIRQLKIGDLCLYNVIGSIIDSPNTPMLLGQSAIERFGTYTIDYNNMILSIQGNTLSKYELSLIEQFKQPGYDLVVGPKLKALSIINDFEFEVVEIKKTGIDNQEVLNFIIDITNNSTIDYNRVDGKMGLIGFTVEVTTEDGKRYTSIDMPISQTLLSGQTANSGAGLSIRGKKPIRLRILPKIF
jgi:clan AA aspartic protease (TIGR02281 family)